LFRIEENAFQDLWDLEKLYLSKNGISAIYRDTFKNMPSLEKLYLDDNLVKDIGTHRDYYTAQETFVVLDIGAIRKFCKSLT
jgi:Leucine-rich repeat (LRR) protein